MDRAAGRRNGGAEIRDADDSDMRGAEIDYARDVRARIERIDNLDGAVRDCRGKAEVESDGL
jgi:hypothetical protein